MDSPIKKERKIMIHTFMENEFTNSNYYVLTFKLQLQNSWFLFGHNPSMTNFDGLYLAYNKMTTYSMKQT